MKRIGLLALIVMLSLAATALAQSPFGPSFDHFTTGFPLEGAHRNVDCQRCHVGGIFQGTPRECSTCHARAGLVKATPLAPDHVLTTTQCRDCHFETTWSPVRRMDHSQVIGSCGSCHNGRQAGGKPPKHPVSDDRCESCHRPNSWLPAGFDHAGVAGSCSSCHNGQQATGKNQGHISTTNVCEDCHRPVAWSPVLRVDHMQTLGSCFSCHNGTTATGKHPGHLPSDNNCEDCHTTNAWVPAVFDHATVMPGTCSTCHNGRTATGKHPGHIQTTGECDACHTTVAWLPANFDHDNITGACSSCHNGVTATGKNRGHFVTNLECNACHATVFWLPHQFRHGSPNYPGDHRRNPVCTDCHGGNSQVVTWPMPAYQPDCAGCHANDFKLGPHKKTANPNTYYTVSELRNCSGACHIYTDTTMTVIKKQRNGPEHRVNDGGF